MNFFLIAVGSFVVFVFALIFFIASRYKRCPSNKILAIYGKVGTGKSVKCFHGGGAFVWPLIQDSKFLDLTPMTIKYSFERSSFPSKYQDKCAKYLYNCNRYNNRRHEQFIC